MKADIQPDDSAAQAAYLKAVDALRRRTAFPTALDYYRLALAAATAHPAVQPPAPNAVQPTHRKLEPRPSYVGQPKRRSPKTARAAAASASADAAAP